MVHRALWEYLSEIAKSDDKEREKMFYEIFERLYISPLLIPPAHWDTAAKICLQRWYIRKTEAGLYASSWHGALQKFVVFSPLF